MKERILMQRKQLFCISPKSEKKNFSSNSFKQGAVDMSRPFLKGQKSVIFYINVASYLSQEKYFDNENDF